MRRKDREITRLFHRVIASGFGFNDDGQVYIVPLNYGYFVEADTYIFYFHGAREERKIELIQKSPYVYSK